MSGVPDLFMPLSAQTRQQLARSGAANISNCLLKRGFRNTFLVGLQSIAAAQDVLVGPAFTVRFIPAREDLDSMSLYVRNDNLHRRAIEECPPGAVLVLAPGGDNKASVMGDIMALRLKIRGVAGVVTDGGFRDTPGIRSTTLPCFQRAASGPATPISLHPVDFNAPVGCAGVPIYAGDVIVGDDHGVVAIPRHVVDEVAEEASANADYEHFAKTQIMRGRSIFGLFPATPESRMEYEQWVNTSQPSQEK